MKKEATFKGSLKKEEKLRKGKGKGGRGTFRGGTGVHRWTARATSAAGGGKDETGFQMSAACVKLIASYPNMAYAIVAFHLRKYKIPSITVKNETKIYSVLK